MAQHDYLDCLMAVAELEGYGIHYGKMVTETTPYQRQLIAERGRKHLERRDALREANARRRTPRPKGEGRYV